MAVKTNITINIVEPGSDVPVPDTGLFTHGIGGTEATIILSVVLVLAIASIVLATYMYRKHKKQGRTTKLVHIIDQTKAVVKSKKRITIGLSIIALLVSACTFTAFMLNTNKSNTSAIEGNDTEQQSENTEQTENTNNLTINAESKELTIEVKDQPVFAVLPVQVTVEEATQAGYTLTAYTGSTDLVSTTNPNNKIPMVTVEGDELTTLQDNTWGLALDNEPTSKDNKVYKALSTDQDNPTLITDKDYEETEANDTTTIYYGFYITPDIPYGTYIGGEVEYEAEENKVATVTFDGNGLYFDNNPSQTQNVVKFIPGTIGETKYSHTSNLDDAGEVIDYSSYYSKMYPINTSETFVYEFPGTDWIYFDLVKSGSDRCGVEEGDTTYFSFWPGAHPEYTAETNYGTSIKAFGGATGKYEFGLYPKTNIKAETIVEENSLTFAYTIGSGNAVYYETGGNSSTRGCGSGYGYYAVITGYNPHTAISGGYGIPDSNTSHSFLGWSTDPDATTAMYSIDDILNPITFDIDDIFTTTLYAVWAPTTTIVYDGNGGTGTMEDQVIPAGQSRSLNRNEFTREDYIFTGWSTNVEGEGQSYADEADYHAGADPASVTLFAQWKQAVYMQDIAMWGSTLNNGDGIEVVDKRDGKLYWVAKLEDGNIWMTQNLDLDIDSTKTYTPADTDISANWTPVRSTTANTTWDTSNTGNTVPHSYDPGNLYWNGNVTTGGGTISGGTVANPSATSGGTHYHIGNYYNWTAAVAMNDSSSYTTNQQDVNQSICPAGWRLPTYSGDKSYENLVNMQGLTAGTSGNIQNAPTYFVYSGFWNGGSMEVGFAGHFRSSVFIYNVGSSCFNFFASGNLSPQHNNNRVVGFSVRCVAK